ncbi:MAG: hypothetical protein HY270_23740, partial [Deltaproteobacteria bacterium]|nr:hypothetical protein [Deltaproteobacteria bacterium]
MRVAGWLGGRHASWLRGSRRAGFAALGVGFAVISLLTLRTVPALAACVGDCGEDDEVTVDELITMVNIALESTPVSACPVGDVDDDGAISINEIIA